MNDRVRDLKNKTRLELRTSKYRDVGLRGVRDPEEEGGALTASSSRSAGGDERQTAANAVKLAHLQFLQQREPIKTVRTLDFLLASSCVIYKLVCSHPAHSGTLKNTLLSL